jgi:putative sigma-54 modulation protein
MRLELTGRHVDITPALRRLVDTKLARLERLLNDSAVSAQAVLTVEKRRRRADITVHARGEKFLHGVGHSTTWEASVGEAIDKIAQQAHKVKGKWQERKRRGRPRMPRVLRAARQPIKPMTVADAAREVDANGDGVVVFRDPVTSSINVLYRRPNGELTLVETET